MELLNKLTSCSKIIICGIVVLWLAGCNEAPPRARVSLAMKEAINIANLHVKKKAFSDALRLVDPKYGVGDRYDVTLFVTRPGLKKMKAVLLKEESGALGAALIDIETGRIWNDRISDDFIKVAKPEEWLAY